MAAARQAALRGSRTFDSAEEAIIDEATAAYDGDMERAYEELRNADEAERQGVKVWVYLVPTDATGTPKVRERMEYLFVAPVDMYTIEGILEKVRTEYMEPTDKRWIIRVLAREEGKSGIKYNRLHVVRPVPAAARKADEGKSQLGEIMAQVTAMLETQQRRQDELITRLAAARPAATPPPADTFSAKDMIAMILATQQSSMQTLTGFAHAIGGGARGASADPVGQFDSMLGAFEKLRGMLGGAGGNGGGGDDSTLGVIKALSNPATEFLKLLQRTPTAPAANGAPRLTAPTAAPASVLQNVPRGTVPPVTAAPAAPTAAPPSQPEAEPMLAMMRAQLETLARVAAESPQPEAARESGKMLLQMMPEEYDEQLYQLINDPNWWGRLCMLQPAVKVHQGWFQVLRDEILGAYNDPDSDRSNNQNAAPPDAAAN